VSALPELPTPTLAITHTRQTCTHKVLVIALMLLAGHSKLGAYNLGVILEVHHLPRLIYKGRYVKGGLDLLQN
jgi:hypothetical protein